MNCDPMNCSLVGSSVHGILQARILEWVDVPSPRESSQPRDQTRTSYVSCIGRQVLCHCWCQVLVPPGKPYDFLWLQYYCYSINVTDFSFFYLGMYFFPFEAYSLNKSFLVSINVLGITFNSVSKIMIMMVSKNCPGPWDQGAYIPMGKVDTNHIITNSYLKTQC